MAGPEDENSLEVTVAVQKNDIKYIRESLQEIKQTLNGETGLCARVGKLETKIETQNSIAGRLVSLGLPALTGLTGIFAGHFWK